MTKAIPEQRGDFDRGRIKDALIFRAGGVRAGLFVNEVGDIGCCVDLPEGGALTFSIAPNDLIHLLRAKLAAPQPAQTAPEAQPAVTQAGAAMERQALAATDVLAERARQVGAEGWKPEHDDTHELGELAHAAACYAANNPYIKWLSGGNVWPYGWEWKPKGGDRKRLVKAGALILAEIERLDRAGLDGAQS
jgi:hypothetical protein